MAVGGPDAGRVHGADLAFHRAILDASANPFLQSIGSVIEAALATSFTISSPVDEPERLAPSGLQHQECSTPSSRGEPQAASDAMTTVIREGASNAHLEDPDAPSVNVSIKLIAGSAEYSNAES